jgi:peptidoglycan/xylan/chitin deacetylase (PgdA/CDA1 family)
LLRIVADAGVKITVFAVGQWLLEHRTLGADLLRAGHELGNHTWSHQVMTRLDLAEATLEVQRGADAVATVLGHPGLLFRPSGTPRSNSTIRSAANASGYPRCISYDVDSLDYLDPGPTAVRTRTLAAVRAGSIVSMHFGHAGTVDALPGILSGLADMGLRLVTIGTMFQSG